MKDVRGSMLIGSKDRMLWPDWARAAAMLFILLGHAEVSIPYVSRFALLFYVPVFFLVSGCVYRMREESFCRFAKRRAKRLLVSYLQYSLFLFLCYNLKLFLEGNWTAGEGMFPLIGILYGRYTCIAGGNGTAPVLLTVWNSPLWFLPALFLSELLFNRLCRRSQGNRKRLAVLLGGSLGAGILLHDLIPALLPWSLECIPLFVVWIGAGYLIRPFLPQMRYSILLMAGAAALAAWKNGTMNVSIGIWGNSVLAGMAGTVCASIVLLYGCFVLEKWLGRRQCAGTGKSMLFPVTVLGRNTMPVLGLHLFVFMWIPWLAERTGAETMGRSDSIDALLRVCMVILTIAGILTGTCIIRKLRYILQQNRTIRRK